MKDTVAAINNMADSKPIYTGVIGAAAGWGTAIIQYMDFANKFMAFIGTFFGAIAAIYTAMIVIRRYHRGYNDDKKDHPHKKH